MNSSHNQSAEASTHVSPNSQAVTSNNSEGNLPPEARGILEAELSVFNDVRQSIAAQLQQTQVRFITEARRAQELTAELVTTRRNEDKALLASDEAVSHAITAKSRVDIKTLEKLMDKPYFARLCVREVDPQGAARDFEYRIGVAANTECRIIDWRKAPISKLYYEYKEGEEYEESIQGRERIGAVVLRRQIDSHKGAVVRIAGSFGSLSKRSLTDSWRYMPSRVATRSGSNQESQSSRDEQYGQLRDVLALITPEQFRMITEDVSSAVLIQGIAGSGKTTVALHRLAWLLHPDNSNAEPSECCVIALSVPLRNFIKKSLEHLGIGAVPVLTFEEWVASSIRRLNPKFVEVVTKSENINGKVTETRHLKIRRIEQSDGAVPQLGALSKYEAARVKRSMAMLQALERSYEELMSSGVEDTTQKDFACNFIISILKNPNLILSCDDARELSVEAINAAFNYTDKLYRAGCLDPSDDALLMRLYQLRFGEGRESSHSIDSTSGGFLDHVVVDEIQEFSPPELACIISSVEQSSRLTLVGDTFQDMSETKSFPGWEKLRQRWDLGDGISSFLSLTVSHRSTLPIMRVADHVLRRSLVTDGREGRAPIWFSARREAQGIGAVITWLTTAMERYSSALTAVICADAREAKLVYSFLHPTFGLAVRLGDDFDFSFQEGIVVTDVMRVKGIEFTNVVLWNPSARSYPENSKGQNSLYVAITRAEENLCIATWGQPPSPWLPSVRSPLIRGHEIQDPPPEEEA